MFVKLRTWDRIKIFTHYALSLFKEVTTRRGDGRDLCVYAVGRADGGPRGLGRDVRPPRRIPTGLAHLLSSTGGPRAAGAGLVQSTGRWASESRGSGQTDGEDTPFQGLYSESAPSAR